MILEGPVNVLKIDLESSSWKLEEREDLVGWLGGVGVATQLFMEEAAWDKPPLAPEQPIIFAIGPFSGIYPLATKVVAVFRSPLTEEWGESYAGMRAAIALRFAGYDAVVIKGKAPRPTYLVIDEKGVAFKDARGVWGLDTEETGRLLREFEGGRGRRSIWRIGPAGENLVPLAGVNVDTYRHFGRLGLGALLGSKNLKALVVLGNRSYPIKNPTAYNRVYEKIYRAVVGTPLLSKYHYIGTAENILALNAQGSLPTLNLKASRFEKAEEVSGERFGRESLFRILACAGCPLGCIHVGVYRRPHPKGAGYISTTLAYDYEPIYALGPMLGLDAVDKVYALLREVEASGLDVISTGVVLAWATEALERGVVSEKETLVPLRFGAVESYIQATQYLAQPPNDFYRALGRGLRYATRIYGGEDFALILGGHEMAGYHTGYAFLLGQSVGARHSHLCNAGYSFDQTRKGDYTPEELVQYLLEEEAWRNVLNSLVICLFARKAYTPEVTAEALQALGRETDPQELMILGRKILRQKWEAKKRLGYTLDQIPLPPRRYFETPSGQGLLDPETYAALLKLYREKFASFLNA
ncbi:Aldehyde ferredoxin oxidoreductase [Ammonifex degensii KC4]|uniref:Aldehyde ferredoxin oxidoreductase n=1 Tax=Ammonifex degensii (strain DSM 10501 / KC4) TaxID=429009 RepID=C9R953_AMMDK|nr:aldehyde ferredoxin oxidoreductase N-terminal domain-containing protein [Ammonifex degensii]ACX52832.1 Aldehyde ferredoxin oxidoreductase [Ammonifex degensii KC4]